jgi:hypothetical protein
MAPFRTFQRKHRTLAALILGAMLSMRLLMPSGFMLAPDVKLLTVVICTGVVGEHRTAQLLIPQNQQKPGHDAGKTDPCPYSASSMASTAAADVPLLAAALAFILALGFAAVAAIPRERAPRLRPPLRGPPVFA